MAAPTQLAVEGSKPILRGMEHSSDGTGRFFRKTASISALVRLFFLLHKPAARLAATTKESLPGSPMRQEVP